MKKLLFSMFLLVFGLCLVGCVDTPNGPGSEQPVGEYDNNRLYSMYPLFVSQDQHSSKFEINHTFEDGIFSTVEDLEDIECESLSSLFDCNYSDEYLKENFVALYFERVEGMWNESLCNVSYYDLFIENGQIYVTKSYDDYENMGDDVIAHFSELILIPKEWQQKLSKTSNFEVNYNVEFNNSNKKNKYIMRYPKMQEFKDAYRKQVLDKKYDDQMYREIYMLDVYGEYNDCLVATVTWDGYVHTDVEIRLSESFRMPLGYYIEIAYDAHYPIWVCYNDALYTLTQAYNNGYLTIDDIKQIFAKNAYYIFGHTHDYIDGLCECGEFDSVWLNENFRLSEEQILFDGSVDDEFNCDVILLTLKHTTTYIELSKRHFKLDEITEVVYISSTPPSHFYEPGNEDKLNNYHQIVFLHVTVESKEEIIELIKELEKLPFIRSAEPNYIEHGE